MSVATSVIVTAAIAGGASLGSAAIQSHAANKAADKQKQSADEATKLQRDVYDQQRNDSMPWLRAGQGAISTLGALSGIPMGGGVMPGASQYGQQQQPGPMAQQAHQPTQNAQPTGQNAVPRSLANIGAGEQGMVGLRGPDGSTRYVPQGQVDFYTQRGATRF